MRRTISRAGPARTPCGTLPSCGWGVQIVQHEGHPLAIREMGPRKMAAFSAPSGLARRGRAVVAHQHVLQAGGELGIPLGQNHAVPHLAPRDAVFLQVQRTVSWRIESTMPSSTMRRASSHSDQFLHPCGGVPRRSGVRRACCLPSSSFGTAGPLRQGPHSARSKPPRTHRHRGFPTVST